MKVFGNCRERKEVDRWSPEKTMSDSPSGKVCAKLQAGTCLSQLCLSLQLLCLLQTRSKTPASTTVQKVIANAEGVLASPVSAVKKTRLAKSMGATATSPSPPKLRSRQTPAKA